VHAPAFPIACGAQEPLHRPRPAVTLLMLRSSNASAARTDSQPAPRGRKRSSLLDARRGPRSRKELYVEAGRKFMLITVRDIGIASGREPDVQRAEGARAISLTFRGTSDARSSVDRNTRIRIALSPAQAARLWRLLGERLTAEEKQRATE
jgi:hypothetical protein